MKAHILPSVQFAFRDDQSRSDKLRGLVEFGPFSGSVEEPTFGFVFPTEYRDSANHLYLALKNGMGSFKGVESTFRFRLSRNQVFPVTGFSIRGRNPHDAAKSYEDAILHWSNAQSHQPHIFFVIHPQTTSYEADTPYYRCKAKLLGEGLLSQNVTVDLLQDEDRLRWSAANIALGAFVKLGGIPWVVYGKDLEQELVIGLGRSYLFDPVSRQTTGYMGFTACFSARGQFQFLTIADVTHRRDEYLRLLQTVVSTSLAKAEGLNRPISTLTLHVPKRMSRDEMTAIYRAIEAHPKVNILQLVVAKVSDEETFFAVDSQYKDGIPRRGTVVQLGDSDYLLYTEGRDEREPWAAYRTPVALRVTPLGGTLQKPPVRPILRQVNDLSQVNWRGFNARSKPISIYYGTLIARMLSHFSAEKIQTLSGPAKGLLESRMWFL